MYMAVLGLSPDCECRGTEELGMLDLLNQAVPRDSLYVIVTAVLRGNILGSIALGSS